MASLILRGQTWHAAWRFRGRWRSRSTKVRHDGKTLGGKPVPPAAAKRELRKIEAELARGLDYTRTTLEDLLALVEADYAVSGYTSDKSLQSRLKHIRKFFGRMEARAVSQADLIEYAAQRDAARSTINRELEVIGRALNLGRRSGKTDNPLVPQKLKAPPPRKGFFDDVKIAALLKHLPDYLQRPTRFGYLTGWRRGEVFGLEWKDVDFRAGEIRLWESKNDEPRVFPLTPGLRKVIGKRPKRDLLPWVFRHGGKPIRDFRKAWESACKAAGCPGMIFHDLRRSAARRMEMQGVPRSVIMALMGHKTEAMFHRYRIVSHSDLRDVGKLLAANPERPDSKKKGSGS